MFAVSDKLRVSDIYFSLEPPFLRSLRKYKMSLFHVVLWSVSNQHAYYKQQKKNCPKIDIGKSLV